MVSIVHLILVHVEIAHDSPVECLEGHGVCVVAEAEFVLGLHDLLQILDIFLSLVVLELMFLEDRFGRSALEDGVLVLE